MQIKISIFVTLLEKVGVTNGNCHTYAKIFFFKVNYIRKYKLKNTGGIGKVKYCVHVLPKGRQGAEVMS